MPLRLIPATTVIPIVSGPSRGHRWIAGSSTHGCWLGTYEPRSQRLACELAHPGDVVWDIGANVGFFTLLFSRHVGRSGRVVAFEPLPRNISLLRRHLEMNRASNVEVEEVAVGSRAGRARFVDERGASQGMLDPRGTLAVEVVTIDGLLAEGTAQPPRLIKLDIEGGELEALRGAALTLRDARPTIWIETHGARTHSACRELLLASEYQLRREEGTAPSGWGLLVAAHHVQRGRAERQHAGRGDRLLPADADESVGDGIDCGNSGGGKVSQMLDDKWASSTGAGSECLLATY